MEAKLKQKKKKIRTSIFFESFYECDLRWKKWPNPDDGNYQNKMSRFGEPRQKNSLSHFPTVLLRTNFWLLLLISLVLMKHNGQPLVTVLFCHVLTLLKRTFFSLLSSTSNNVFWIVCVGFVVAAAIVTVHVTMSAPVNFQWQHISLHERQQHLSARKERKKCRS